MPSTKKRACEGKTKFVQRDSAYVAMVHYSQSYGAAKNALEVYKCKHCDNFHFGHKKRRRANR